MTKSDVNRKVNSEIAPKKKPRGISKIMAEPIDADITKQGVAIYKMIAPPVGYDRKDPIQAQKQLDNFIDVIMSTGVKCGNMMLYTALGINHRDTTKLLSYNDEFSDILKRGMDFCTMMREYYSSNGSLNVVLSLFWSKNYDGLTDKQEITVTPGQIDDIPPQKLIESVNDLPIN